MTYECNDIIKEIPPVFTAKHELLSSLERITGQVTRLVGNEAHLLEKIQQLETDLGVYKRAYGGMEAERKQLELSKIEAEKQKDLLLTQLKGHRIIALLDGDGTIFSNQLIGQGYSGGHIAAQMLSDSVMQYLSSNCGSHQYQLWVYVFLNKRGLMDAFGRSGFAAAKQKFDDFAVGFNQAAERFLMVDVGNTKEAADAKIKAMLEDDIRLPQTEKIIFGGCHDNGYITTLRSQITAGYKQKIILLRSYTEIAAGIVELDLPILTIPDLFMTQKLGTTISAQPAVTTPPLPPPATVEVVPLSQSPIIPARPIAAQIVVASPEPVLDPLPFFVEPDIEGFSLKRRTASYSSAVLKSRRAPTPELESSGSTTSSDEGDEIMSNPRASPTFSRSRHINPNVPLSKQKPPPCTLFYLANCKHGVECKFAHDYILQPEHFVQIRTNAKKAPCPAINKGEICLWGEDCCYGHKCPLTSKCHFLKQGRCKFIGDMHKEPKGQIIVIG